MPVCENFGTKAHFQTTNFHNSDYYSLRNMLSNIYAKYKPFYYSLRNRLRLILLWSYLISGTIVESLHDVLPKGLLAEIPLLELPFVLRHELSERAKEAKVQNICIGWVCHKLHANLYSYKIWRYSFYIRLSLFPRWNVSLFHPTCSLHIAPQTTEQAPTRRHQSWCLADPISGVQPRFLSRAAYLRCCEELL